MTRKILCILLCLLLVGIFNFTALADDGTLTEVYDKNCINIVMEHDVSVAKENFEAEYFHDSYVEYVKPLMLYKGGYNVNKEVFKAILCLYLNEEGKNNIDSFIDELNNRDDVFSAEKRLVGYTCNGKPVKVGGFEAVTTNDPYFSNQYALSKIMAQKAWAITTGSSSIKIGIVDTGINSNHEDLPGKVNTLYSNSFVDSDVLNYTDESSNSHGTHIAGIIGAKVNNSKGISGLCWNTSLVALKVGTSTSSIDENTVIEAMSYARDFGINILNMSFSTSTTANSAFRTAFNNFNGLCIVSAGATGDVVTKYPAKYNSSSIITVAATTSSDSLWSSSSYGTNYVNLAAPGTQIYSTINTSAKYGNLSGTSMSVPYVTATVALMKAANPSLSWSQIKSYLYQGVDELDSLDSKVSTGGRLNTFRAVRLAAGYIMGDANLDGVVHADDGRAVLRWVSDLDSYSNLQEALCDVNYNGVIDAADARLISRIAADLEDPVE